jgi:CubicO group peptidase (beta-lactamase class C family)
VIGRRAFLLGTVALGLAGAASHARASGLSRLSADAWLAYSADDSGADDAMLFDRWVASYAPETAVLVVRRAGQMFARAHRTNADFVRPVASLSKAITACAVASLVRDGRLSFDTPMRVALAEFFTHYGPPIDPHFLDVTVEQLLVHRSGLLGNPDRDPMQEIRRERIARGFGHIAAPQPLIAEHLQRYPLAREPDSRFAYSNTGYLTLTAIIEEAAHRSYEEYCQEAVLGPLGVTGAQLNPEVRSWSGAGGWIVTGADYIRFYDIFDRGHPLLGEAVQDWIAAARERWGANPRGRWYSLGVQTSITAEGRQVQHSGLGPMSGRVVPTVVRSFVRRKPNGDTFFLSLTQPRADQSGMRDLVPALDGDVELQVETPSNG